MSRQLSKAELECIGTVSRLAEKLAIPIFVIGASASELAFNSPHGIPPHRSTRDWDFGVQVESWAAFTKFKEALLGTGQFRADAIREHRLLNIAGIPIDLVPFGGLEIDGQIRWPGSGSMMDVIGFSDACEHCAKVDVAANLRLNVALPPLLAALKLLAFADRKDTTDRDILDVWHLMTHYLEAGESHRIWEEPIASALGEEYDWRNASACVLGYDVARDCRPATVARLLPIVATLSDPFSRYVGPLIRPLLSQEEEMKNREEVAERFGWLKRGVEIGARSRGS
jgi:predicted nucleotidyltransferase